MNTFTLASLLAQLFLAALSSEETCTDADAGGKCASGKCNVWIGGQKYCSQCAEEERLLLTVNAPKHLKVILALVRYVLLVLMATSSTRADAMIPQPLLDRPSVKLEGTLQEYARLVRPQMATSIIQGQPTMWTRASRAVTQLV